MIVLWPDSYCHNSFNWVEEADWLTSDAIYPTTYMAMIDRLTTAEEDDDSCPTGALTLG